MRSGRILPGADAFRFDGGPLGMLLQHGFTGCPASMRPFGQWLSERGVAVVAPRLPGHGTVWQDLEGVAWRDWESEAERALAELSSRCTGVIVAGLSMGGAMALHLGAKHPDTVRGVVAINGLVRRPEFALAPVIRLFTRSVKGVGNDIKKPGQDEIVYDRIPLKGINELGKFLRTVDRELPSLRVPLRVFSAPEDHTVKPFNSRRIMERAGSSDKELVSLPNSYHVATLDYDAETVFERSLEFARSVTGNGVGPGRQDGAGSPRP
jgi:carboxylesterase